MKKNAMCHIAVGVLSTCLAGAALANGGPADVCNSNNIKRSEIVPTTNANKNQKADGKNITFKFTRRIENTAGVNCVVVFNGGAFYFKGSTYKGYEAIYTGKSSIVMMPGAVTDLFSNNANDITYQRAWTTARVPPVNFSGIAFSTDY